MPLHPAESQSALSHDDANRLTSWKEIAAFLQVSVKTAQRYEAERGLPVKRIGARVSVTAAELTAWQKSSVVGKPWWQQAAPLQRITAALASILLVGAGYIGVHWWGARPGPVQSAAWEGQTLVARDSAGKEGWRHTFAGPVLLKDISPLAPIYPRVADMDGDGRPEVLAVYHHVRRDEDGWDLSCLGTGGELRWKIGETEGVSSVSNAFKPPYVIRSFVPFDSPERDGTKWVAATFVHYHDWPSVLIVADSRGKIRGRHWHAGHLNDVVAVDVNNDGLEELVAGGVQHGMDRAHLIVFDPRRVSGATVLPKTHPMSFREQQPGSQIRTIYFQRTRLNQKVQKFNFLSRFSIGADGLHAEVYESLRHPEAYLLYKLGRDLRLLDVSPSVSFGDAMKIEREKSTFGEFTPAGEIERLKREVLVVEGANHLSMGQTQ